MGVPTGMLNKLVSLSSPQSVAIEGARNVPTETDDSFNVWAYVMRRGADLQNSDVFREMDVLIENTPQTLNIKNNWTATVDGQVYFVDTITADGNDKWILGLKNRE